MIPVRSRGTVNEPGLLLAGVRTLERPRWPAGKPRDKPPLPLSDHYAPDYQARTLGDIHPRLKSASARQLQGVGAGGRNGYGIERNALSVWVTSLMLIFASSRPGSRSARTLTGAAGAFLNF